MSFPYDYIGSIASNQTKDFLRPKTTFEKAQYILSIAWFLIAFLASIDLQAYLFFLILAIFLVNLIYLITSSKPRSSFLSTVLKFGFFFFIYIFLVNPRKTEVILYSITITDIVLVQKSTLAILIILGLFFKYVRLQLLKPSSKKKVAENYSDFFFQIAKGISYSIFLYVFFGLIDWVPNLVTQADKFPNSQDILLIIASLLLIISSQGPEGKDLTKLFAQELFLVSQTRFERLRDAILKVSIILLFYLKILPIFTPQNKTLVTVKYWTDAATVLFVIGIITLILSLFENRGKFDSSFSKLSNDLSEKSFALLPEKLTNFKNSMENVSLKPESQQFFKLKEDFPLIDKEKTKFIAKKNSIAIPVKETPDGTAVIFVGESDIENITEQGTKIKNSLEELATTVMIPKDVWNKANLSLEAIKPSDETIKALTLKGIESKEKLLALAESSLSEFKNMTNSKMITQRFQGMADNFRQGKYFVSDTKKGTVVRLPGITVIENDETTFVRVFGIKVLESQGHTVVNMPFIKVIETPEYQLVNLPGINVIEAGNSELVNLMGFQILDGDRKEIEDARLKIQNQSPQINSAFKLLDSKIDSVLSNPDRFLLARNSSGKTINLLTSTSSDSALIDSNLLPIPFSKSSSLIKKDFKKKNKSRIKIQAGRKITTNEASESNLYADTIADSEIDSIIQEASSPEAVKLGKLYRIIKMSHSSIELSRLASLLDFNSVTELEKWLIDLNIPHLQINWEENKLLINEGVNYGLKKLLKKMK